MCLYPTRAVDAFALLGAKRIVPIPACQSSMPVARRMAVASLALELPPDELPPVVREVRLPVVVLTPVLEVRPPVGAV
jgi:hypothetical protein